MDDKDREIARLNQALRAAEHRLGALSDSYPIGVYHCDEMGARTYTNFVWQQIFGLTGQASLGHAWLHAVHPQDRASVSQAWREAIAAGHWFDREFSIVRPDGTVRIVRSQARPVVPGVPSSGFIGALADITESRGHQRDLEREKALRQQSEEHARELDRLLTERSEMLDVMAHEVRQPLNNASAALQSAAGALRDVGDGGASRRVTSAQAVMAQVLASIDNTLAVASLLARPDPIDQIDTDIDTMIEVAITDLPANERPRIRIERLTQTRTASMDMSLMRLAVRNVLSNALKYSPPGSEVVVRVFDADEPLALVIDVADTGGAIPAELLPMLFTRGARGQHGGVAAGHGLGLYIVRRVMELHGGQVEVARNQADGVTFRLWVTQSPD